MEVKPNTLWKHRAGGTYFVSAVGVFMCSTDPSLDNLPIVIYESIGTDVQYVRLLEEFSDGRFKYMGEYEE